MFDAERLVRDVDDLAPRLEELARELHAHPELAYEEHASAERVAKAVEREGRAVERGAHGLATSVRARAGAGEARVVICAEYDALPEIGHACGHNLIAAGATLAFLALARQADALGGVVELLGTPAEEGGGGKLVLLERGAFEGASAAMMFHPFDRDLLAHPTLAIAYVDLEFKGKASHAAIAPWGGKSALTACLDTFRLVDGQRVHLRDGTRVHGIVRDGGQAANIVPERAAAEFAVRAPRMSGLRAVLDVVARCAKGAAVASDVEVVITERAGYRDLASNLALASRFGEHLRALGHAPELVDPAVGTGSTDMGDVSHAVPSIHPWIAIVAPGESTCHQRAFAEAARGDRAMRAMRDAALAMARTAADVLGDPGLRERAKADFDSRHG